MSKLRAAAIALAAAAACGAAHADSSINLANYQLGGIYSLAPLNGLGLEASAVTYARDRGTLFFVGDEGLGVVEITRTGQTVSTMTFSGGPNLGWPSASTNRDAEGLTYLGNGVLVVAEERLQDLFKFTYVANGTTNLAGAPYVSISDVAVGNNGIEGVSYDPRGTGSFVTVKQLNPENVLGGTVTFEAPPGSGTSSMAPLFDPAKLGLASLSDVQTLATVPSLLGTPAADNLLILSLDSRKLVEANRNGDVLSFFDLAGITTQAIEGVTIDENGVIYLVAENLGTAPSQLIVLQPVPEPGTWALMITGLGLLGFAARRRRSTGQ